MMTCRSDIGVSIPSSAGSSLKMVNTKFTKAKPGHRCSLCGKRFPTEDKWSHHTIQCARELREELAFECQECDYATKRERDLKRHAESQHRTDNLQKEKTGRNELDDLGKDPGDLHHLIGLKNTSQKPAAAGEKKRSADDSPVFAPPRKIFRVTQGDAPDKTKIQSKSAEGHRKKSTSADKEEAKNTISTSTQTQESDGQVVSTEVQTETSDRCDCGIQTSPVKKLVHHSVTRTVTYRDNHKKIKEVEVDAWDSESD
ncbi:uncharacterized protein LOC130054228 [Ostrea edulis]|uniref:uncharacterized protein LOC130054228 n=1 Tax=Ostrea edulis TaxID=37623 RepID=UPI0024AED9F5|nr:uncharacterized protein LOC130054228 [Ostrea edulis]